MITHHEDCMSHEDDNFCDCDFWERLEKEQEEHNKMEGYDLSAMYLLRIDCVHDWQLTDTQGHHMECVLCGKPWSYFADVDSRGF